ncbi:hypothetical protein DL95DRAFT_256180, partial [Leptodontidium sp. 2 PMI_412]
HRLAARIQAITMLELNQTHQKIKEWTKISRTSVYRYRKTAIERGWDPSTDHRLEDHHVADAPRSGRPSVSQEVADAVINLVTKNST